MPPGEDHGPIISRFVSCQIHVTHINQKKHSCSLVNVDSTGSTKCQLGKVFIERHTPVSTDGERIIMVRFELFKPMT